MRVSTHLHEDQGVLREIGLSSIFQLNLNQRTRDSLEAIPRFRENDPFRPTKIFVTAHIMDCLSLLIHAMRIPLRHLAVHRIRSTIPFFPGPRVETSVIVSVPVSCCHISLSML
jgi:hypothetical protein